MRTLTPARWSRLLLALTLMVALSGCRHSDRPENGNDPENAPIDLQVEQGPVKLSVRTDKGKVRIAEPFTLTVRAVAPDGVDIEMPDLEGEPNELEITQTVDAPAVPVDGTRQWTRTFTVESFQPGDPELPEIAVKYTDRRPATHPASSQPADQPAEGKVAAPPTRINVSSMLEGEFDPTKYRDIKGPVAVPAPRSWVWLWWLLGVLGVAALALLVVWLRRRRRPLVGVARAVAPDHWARDQLRRLAQERLVERGLIHEFYFRLSGIVREYIERRFDLRAPERTTDEFLAEVRGNPALSTEHQGLLGDFLRAADMVKFARYEPEPAEIDAAFTTARTFVDQTTPSATTAAAVEVTS